MITTRSEKRASNRVHDLVAALLVGVLLTTVAPAQLLDTSLDTSLDTRLAEYHAAKSASQQSRALDRIAALAVGETLADRPAADARIAALALGLESEHVRVRNHAVGLIGTSATSSESALTALRGHCDAVVTRSDKNFAAVQKALKRLPLVRSRKKGKPGYLDMMEKHLDALQRLEDLVAKQNEWGSTIPVLVEVLAKVGDDRAVEGVVMLLPLCSAEELPALRAALIAWGTVASLAALCDRLTYFDDSIASQKKRVSKARRKRPGTPPKGSAGSKDVWRRNKKASKAEAIATLEQQLAKLVKKRDADFDAVRQFAKHCKLLEPPAKNSLSAFGLWRRRAAKELPTTLRPASTAKPAGHAAERGGAEAGAPGTSGGIR